MYPVMSRGDRREDIFLADVDRQDFLKTLAEACQKTDWQVHAYGLRRNHYRLVLIRPVTQVAPLPWPTRKSSNRRLVRPALRGALLG